MLSTTLTLCYWSQSVPNTDNLRRARNTLYQWTRNQAKDVPPWYPLAQILYWNMSAARYAGTPVFTLNPRPVYATFSYHNLTIAQLNQLGDAYYHDKVLPWYESHRLAS